MNKRILLTLLIIGFLALSTVNAEEITNETENFTVSEINNLMTYDDTSDSQTLGDFNENDPNWQYSFTRLKQQIYDTPTRETLYLTNDYIFNDYNGWTITIRNSITIDGRGHVIDANGTGPVFDIWAHNVTLKNMRIINAYHPYGGAIDWIGHLGSCENMIFINNTSPNGGAIFLRGYYSNIDNCTFIDNTGYDRVDNRGSEGAIYLSGSNSRIQNSKFISNKAEYDAGAIKISCHNNTIYNCIFDNNRANHGGSIYLSSGKNNTIIDCVFTNNTANYGEDIFLINDANCTIIDCVFDNDSSENEDNIYIWSGDYKIIQTITAPDIIKYYGGSERFNVHITDTNENPLENQHVLITINNQTYNKTTDSKGNANIAINLNSGVYTVLVEYNNKQITSTANIKSTITAKDFTKIYRNGTQYYATFKDSKGNLLKNTDVEFNINGVFYTRKTNNDGIAKLNINLNPDMYILTAENPLNGEKHSTRITVLANIVENYDLTKYYRSDSQYTVKLLDDTGNHVDAGVSVTFNINGVFYTRNTNADGIAKLNINLGEGTYIITAEYKGFKASNTIEVLPVLSANDLSMNYKDGSKFQAKLIDGEGKAYPGQTVTFNINGVFYERTTGNDGIAKLNINLMPDEYVITSSYNGFNIANKIKISERIINDEINPDIASNTSSNFSSEKNDSKSDIDSNTSGDNDSENYNGINIEDYDAIILNIDEYDKKTVLYNGNYKIEAEAYRNSNTGIDIALYNWKISGTGEYSPVLKEYYTSSIYSNISGKWQWSDWKSGEGVFESTINRYSYWTNNFLVKKVAVKIIEGLSDDGYSFYPDCSASPYTDSHGTTKAYAIVNNMHYIPPSGDNPGGYVSYDFVNECYHL